MFDVEEIHRGTPEKFFSPGQFPVSNQLSWPTFLISVLLFFSLSRSHLFFISQWILIHFYNFLLIYTELYCDWSTILCIFSWFYIKLLLVAYNICKSKLWFMNCYLLMGKKRRRKSEYEFHKLLEPFSPPKLTFYESYECVSRIHLV